MPSEQEREERTEDEPMGDISSLHSFASGRRPRSLRLTGQSTGKEFQFLIYSGSTHNFVHPNLAEKLQVPIEGIQPFRAIVGNKDYLRCRIICPQVPVELQGNSFNIDLHVLPIEGPDMVLGVQWLQTLGKVVNDYSSLQMDFFFGRKENIAYRRSHIPKTNF